MTKLKSKKRVSIYTAREVTSAWIDMSRRFLAGQLHSYLELIKQLRKNKAGRLKSWLQRMNESVTKSTTGKVVIFE